MSCRPKHVHNMSMNDAGKPKESFTQPTIKFIHRFLSPLLVPFDDSPRIWELQLFVRNVVDEQLITGTPTTKDCSRNFKSKYRQTGE